MMCAICYELWATYRDVVSTVWRDGGDSAPQGCPHDLLCDRVPPWLVIVVVAESFQLE